MFSLSKLFVFAALFLKFVSGKRSDMVIGSTEHVFHFEGHAQVYSNRYQTQKIYFYFRASSLVFPLLPGENAFCPPKWEFLQYYMALQKYSPYEIELMAIDDVSFWKILENSREYAWFRVGSIHWLIEYLKNEFSDPDKDNKMDYSAPQTAYRMRMLYDDILQCPFPKSVVEDYKNTIKVLHQWKDMLNADRCGDMISGWTLKVQWLIHDQFSFMPDEALVAQNTNLSHMSKILQSKALFVQSKSRLSHAAIVAQELSKPCFFGIEDIFTSLWHGDEIAFFQGKETISIIKRFYE